MSKIGIIAGSTGLVGSLLLSQMLGDDRYAQVISLVRKKSNVSDPKLQVIIVNCDDLQSYTQHIVGDDLFFYVVVDAWVVLLNFLFPFAEFLVVEREISDETAHAVRSL